MICNYYRFLVGFFKFFVFICFFVLTLEVRETEVRQIDGRLSPLVSRTLRRCGRCRVLLVMAGAGAKGVGGGQPGVLVIEIGFHLASQSVDRVYPGLFLFFL